MEHHLYFFIHQWLMAAIMASARIMPVFMLLPFLNSSVLSGTARLPVIMLTGVALWHGNLMSLPSLPVMDYVALLAKEVMIGVALGCALSFPIWVLHAMGAVIDNQRGATLSSSIDPITGVDSSELANFFNLCVAVIMLESGGLTLILQVIERSMTLWPPLTLSMPNLRHAVGFLNLLVGKSLVLASPAISLFLLTEVFLGLLSRYCPQLNAFSLALSLKSFIAFLILVIYFSPIVPHEIVNMMAMSANLNNW